VSKLFFALAAFAIGAMLVIAANTVAIRQVDVPNMGPVFVWTPEEMDKLENVLTDLLAQRDKLSKQLSNCRLGT
jgi:hypothetical protein